MRRPRCILLLLLFGSLFYPELARAQSEPTNLQPGTPVERTLTASQTHSYNVSLEENQVLQLVVEQHGIDVVVRVFSPNGKRLGEFDSPNGTDGPENVSVIAEATGVYRVDVSPLGGYENPKGRYEIRIVEVRKATEQELQAAKNQEGMKAKGLALVAQIAGSFQELHPQSRARFQIKAARLLWSSDEKRAAKLMEQAIDSVKEFIANINDDDQDYAESYQIALQLRRELIDALAPHDPEMALNFLRATSGLSTPGEFQDRGQANQELELELALAGQIAANDPKRAFQMAEDTLKRGTPSTLVDTMQRLRLKEPELAAKLAHDIIAKLLTEKFLAHPEAAYLAISLLRMVRPFRRMQNGAADESPRKASILSEDEYRDLLQKMAAETLAYSPPGVNYYTPERSTAQNIMHMLKELSGDLEGFAPGSAARIEKKFAELNNQTGAQGAAWQQALAAINSGTVDSALEAVSQAPGETREQLYQQVAFKAAAAGDLTRARQIINDHVTNAMQRQQLLKNLDQQAIHGAAGRGKIDEALRNLSNFRPARERASILSQIVSQIGPNQKKATALLYLEQARSLLGPSPQAGSQEEMRALLEISRAFARYDSDRAFQIIEPLVDQFNDINESAVKMNGFGQTFYRDGELIMTNGNAVAETANQLGPALASLAEVNFERARIIADRIHPAEVRISAYLAIAEQAIQAAQ